MPSTPCPVSRMPSCLLLLCLLPCPAMPSDGFMQDFFHKFPTFPFANMQSLEQHRGSLHRDSLLQHEGEQEEEMDPVKRHIKKVKKLVVKSHLISELSDGDSTTTPSGPEKLVYKSSLLASPSTSRPRRPTRLFQPTPQPQDTDYFDRFTMGKPYRYRPR